MKKDMTSVCRTSGKVTPIQFLFIYEVQMSILTLCLNTWQMSFGAAGGEGSRNTKNNNFSFLANLSQVNFLVWGAFEQVNTWDSITNLKNEKLILLAMTFCKHSGQSNYMTKLEEFVIRFTCTGAIFKEEE